ncbi:MAG: glycosyltransferase [Romboutsia sp.]
MISISLCMIVRDEEDVIERCLKSVVGVYDELIIVDTGSTDKTKEISQKYTDNIYDFEWINDFSKARNFSFEKATKDYILWLDADEFLNEECREKLIFLKSSICTDIDIISLQTYMCLDENNNPRVVGRRNRIVKREKNLKWTGFVHEYIEVEGTLHDTSIYIIHDKVKCCEGRNLNIYKMNIEKGNKLSSRDLYYYGKELYCNKLWEESIEILNIFVEEHTSRDEIIDALCKIGECYQQLNELVKGRDYFYKTFEYGEPRCEVLYNIAKSFANQKNHTSAIAWYEIILGLNIKSDSRQCTNLSCLRFKPHLNLCVCYYEIGDIQKSYYHHLKAKEINPLNLSVLKNDKFFENLQNQN